MTIKVALLGFGRMGKRIAERIHGAQDMEIVAVYDSKGCGSIGCDIGLSCNIGETGVLVEDVDNIENKLKKSVPDIIVDFTHKDACVKNIPKICVNNINLVLGTTGFSSKELENIEKEITGNKVGAVISPNMSIAVNVYLNLVRKASQLLKGYDIEIVEAHHRFKKDAPSGTALRTAEIIASEIGKDLEEKGVYGRKGECPRTEGEIGIHAVRAGDIVGDHTVYFGTIGERLELTHRAHSRDAFVTGVLEAIRFINGKKGIYSMDDVLGLK